MYLPEDAKLILFNYLNVDALTGNMAGSLCYSGSRPIDSDEDVTIGLISLSDNSGQNSTQRGTMNVNIYVKDVEEQGNNVIANVPNNARLDSINRSANNILSGVDGMGLFWEYGNLWVSNISGTLKIAETKEHYINIRVEIKLHTQPIN